MASGPDSSDRGATYASLSSLLRSLIEGPPGRVRMGEVVERLGHRAFGPVLFVFAIPNLLPLPPGSSSVLGLPLLIVAPQLALGVRSPWLPRAVADRSIERATLASVLRRILPRLIALERLLMPRLGFVFGPLGDRLIGAVCFLLALVLILPIPLGNMAPAAAIAAFALGLVQRDGAAALVGYAAAAFSLGLVALSIGAVIAAVARLAAMAGL